MGASHSDLLDVFYKQVRSIVDIAKLERIQKTALHIILGENYRSYSSALKTLGVKKLSERRKQLCLKFAIQAEKHPKFYKWFKPNKRKTTTRQLQPKYCEVFVKKIDLRKAKNAT